MKVSRHASVGEIRLVSTSLAVGGVPKPGEVPRRAENGHHAEDPQNAENP